MNLLVIVICLAVSFLFAELFNRLNLPKVMGQILAGSVLTIPFIYDWLFTPGSLEAIKALSEAGIIFLLFLAGMEINYEKFKSVSKEAVIVAFMSAAISFAFGYTIMKLLGYTDIVSMVLGISLTMTAESETLKHLIDVKKLDTRLGNIIIGAGILDNVIEVFGLTIVLVFIEKTNMAQLTLFPLKLLTFIFLCIIVFKIIPKLMDMIRKEKSEVNEFATAVIVGLFIAVMANFLGFSPIIGAFIAGILIQLSIKDRKEERKVMKDIAIVTFGLIVPFFFIQIGLNIDYRALLQSPFMFFIITIVALAGKLLGSLVVKFFSDLNTKQAILIGWGMNARGAVELVIAEVARVNNLIPIEVYSAIVVMAIVTTFMFPFILRYHLKKYPRIMD